MTTNDLIAALQETLAKYQQNGVEEDSAQRLETQLTDLKANVTQLQDALQSAQEEKRLLLETLREQSQQLLTLTQHVTTTALGVAPQVEAKATPTSTSEQHPEVDAKVDKPTVTKSAKTTSAKGKATLVKAPAKSKSTATKKGVKVIRPESTPPESETASNTPSLDQLWDHVRAFNAGKPFGQRIRFDENLAINHFGFKASEWKDWYKGTNSAKVKRQPPQVRSNQRKAAKEGIDSLKQQWNVAFPASRLTESAPKAEKSSPDAVVAPTETSSLNLQEAAPVATPTVVAEPKSTTDPASSSTKTTSAKKKSKASAAKKASKASSIKKATKKSDKPTLTETSDKTAASNGSKPKAMQELFEFFQSWNQQEGNAAVRFTTHTSAAFDNIEIEQAREWIDQHPDEVKQLNEGIPPNNRRDARQALAQLKATWSVL